MPSSRKTSGLESIWTSLQTAPLVGERDLPHHPRNIARTLTAATQRLGFGHWHPHELRHTAASLMSEAGVPIETIADQLGHDGTRMTLLIYRHAVKPTVSAGNAMVRHLG